MSTTPILPSATRQVTAHKSFGKQARTWAAIGRLTANKLTLLTPTLYSTTSSSVLILRSVMWMDSTKPMCFRILELPPRPIPSRLKTFDREGICRHFFFYNILFIVKSQGGESVGAMFRIRRFSSAMNDLSPCRSGFRRSFKAYPAIPTAIPNNGSNHLDVRMLAT